MNTDSGRCRVRFLRAGNPALSFAIPVLAAFAGFLSSAGIALGAASVTLTRSTTYQTFWGFGASANDPVATLYNDYNATTRAAILDKLFGTTSGGAGLSIVRLEINPFTEAEDPVQTTCLPADGVWDWETDEYQRWFAEEAIARGVTQFYAVPWSPPGWMKTNGSPANGGYLAEENYDKFADYIKTWVDHYRNVFGIPVKWVSVQNEPNTNATWASCLYTTTALDIVAARVADAVHDLDQGVLVGAPEGSGRYVTHQYVTPLSATTIEKLDFVPTHSYGSDFNINARGKPVINTEVCETGANDPSMTDGLRWANMIAASLKKNERGWLHWWAVARTSSGQSLINLEADDAWSVNKRLYVLGQYARWLRPGDTRFLAAVSGTADLVAVAGKNGAGQAALVVINNGSNEISTTITGVIGTELSAWRTSDTEDLAALATIPVVSGKATVMIPAASVTTFIENE
ncbi:glycoside hydrolase family 30 [Opitutaceae bacterium TAV5]|nr:glycoside hydrolase family 30 [Opitutaceae bacterium TAV5]